MAGSSATIPTSELTASFSARKASPQSGGRGSRPPRSNQSERNNGERSRRNGKKKLSEKLRHRCERRLFDTC
jgi:hypothetical protein